MERFIPFIRINTGNTLYCSIFLWQISCRIRHDWFRDPEQRIFLSPRNEKRTRYFILIYITFGSYLTCIERYIFGTIQIFIGLLNECTEFISKLFQYEPLRGFRRFSPAFASCAHNKLALIVCFLFFKNWNIFSRSLRRLKGLTESFLVSAAAPAVTPAYCLMCSS